jgi:hypothetical protein
MIQITGFSKLQMAIADDLWHLETLEGVEHYILALPKRLQPHARVVLDMMIAASLELEEVDTSVAKTLINRIKEDSRKS